MSSTISYPRETTAPSPRAIAGGLDQLAYWSLCAFAFALPWERGEGPPVLPILGVLTFGIAFMRVCVSSPKRRFAEPHYWFIAFALWSAASILWTLDPEATMARIGTYAQLIALAWLVWILASTDARVLGLMQCWVLGTFVCSFGTFSNLLAGRTFGQLDDLEGPKSARYFMTGMNPNDASLLLVPSIAMSLYLLAKRKGNPLVNWMQLVVCALTILLSGSRTALLAALGASAIIPFAIPLLPRWQKALAVVASTAAVIAAILLVPADTWQRIFRLGADMTEGTMTHRTQIWSASLEVFRSHPLIGVGSDAHPAAVVRIVARPLVAHNTFLSVLVELGVVGELLLLGLLAAAFYTALRLRGLDRTFWILLLTAWCIGACSGTWEYRKATWFLLNLLIAHSYVRRQTVRNQEPSPSMVGQLC
jgi:O-antigen ligase